MVEQILFFVLGFLAASLAALACLRAVWSRAVRLTTMRVVTRLPVSPAMIAADRDRLRAAHAIEVRRLERRIEQLSSTGLGPETISTQDKAAIRRLSGELAEARSRIGDAEQQRSADSAAAARPASSPLRETIAAGSRRVAGLLRSGIERLPIGREAAGDANYPAKVAALESEVHSLLSIVGSLETELAARHAEQDRPPSMAAEERMGGYAPAAIPQASEASAGEAETNALVVALAEQAEALEQRLALERQAAQSYRLEAERLAADVRDRDAALAVSAEEAASKAEREHLAADRESIAAELASTLEMLRAERAGSAVDVEQLRSDRARLQARVAQLEEAQRSAGQGAADADGIAAAAEGKRLQGRIAALEEAVHQSAAELETLRAERADIARQADAVRAERAQLQLRSGEWERAALESSAALETLRAERAIAEGTLEQVRLERQRLEQRTADLERQVADVSARLDQARSERAGLAAELAALRSERSGLLGRVAELEAASAAAASASSKVEQVDNLFLRDQLVALAAEIARLGADQDAGAAAHLQAMEPEREALAAGRRR